MNTDTSNKLLLGCFALCLLTMISSIYTNINSSGDEAIKQVRSEISDLHSEIAAIKDSLDKPVVVKKQDSSIVEQFTLLGHPITETQKLAEENKTQISNIRKIIEQDSDILGRIDEEIFGIGFGRNKRLTNAGMSLRIDGLSRNVGEISKQVDEISRIVDKMSKTDDKINDIYVLIAGKGVSAQKYMREQRMISDGVGMAQLTDDIFEMLGTGTMRRRK